MEIFASTLKLTPYELRVRARLERLEWKGSAPANRWKAPNRPPNGVISVGAGPNPIARDDVDAAAISCAGGILHEQSMTGMHALSNHFPPR